MKNNIKKFFVEFLQKHKNPIVLFSFLRILDFIQCLFSPYAFAKIINIIGQDPSNWKQASFWGMLFLINSSTENFVRLRGKLGLEKIAVKLKLSMSTFFSEKTKIRKNKKTGQAVQAVKMASDDIQSSVNFYKDNILQLPVNFIIIPLVLFKANIDYLILLMVYIALYLIIECLTVPIYNQKLQKFFKASEAFWGTTYRKAPEVWRHREDGEELTKTMNREKNALYKADTAAIKINNWRWIFLQSTSSIAIGIGVLFVLYKIVNNGAQIGDLVLVSSYLGQTQGTLNMISDTINRFLHAKTSLKRLGEAVEIT